VKGGILTPSYLQRILQIAKNSGNKHVFLGSRQDLLFNLDENQSYITKKSFDAAHIDFIIQNNKRNEYQNIVSSYVAADILPSTLWLTSGDYLQILENFRYQPRLRINITDPAQNLIPYFFGNLNYVASSYEGYWYLFIRRTFDELPVRWPLLVLTDDISMLSQTFEKYWESLQKGSIHEWFETIQSDVEYNGRNVESELQQSFSYPADYEGFNKMHNSQNYWAGFYWRNNQYSIEFLEEICNLCLQTEIAKICLTPWKSIIIKDIRERDILEWNRLIGQYGITMRHSSFDLNWHIPLNDQKALKLKQKIVRKFDKTDVCVHGFTIGIKSKDEFDFYTIKVEPRSVLKFLGRFDVFETYTISHAKNFNPNLCEYINFAHTVPRMYVAKTLRDLTRKFYIQLSRNKPKSITKPAVEKENTRNVYQCKHCLSIYDSGIGMPEMGIPAGVAFENLPESFCCELCDAPKGDFKEVLFNKLVESVPA
jgi:rubredoxin